MLRVITLFSGYDSQCLALNRLKRHHPAFGYELVAWCEVDRHAIAAHNALFPQWADRNLGDISQVDWAQVPPCDLLTYSSPCQDFSTAGKQQGGTEGSGTRSSLLWECRKAIEALRPRYLLFENVPALVSDKFMPTFLQWGRTLEALGYSNYWQCLNAKNYGVPQSRNRVFMVSVRRGCQPAPYYFPKPFRLERRLKDVLETSVPERYYLSDERVQKLIAETEEHQSRGNGVSPTIDASAPEHHRGVQIVEPPQQPCSAAVLQVGNLVQGSGFDNPQRGRVYSAEGVAPTLNCEGGGGSYDQRLLPPPSLTASPASPSSRCQVAISEPTTPPRGAVSANGRLTAPTTSHPQ